MKSIMERGVRFGIVVALLSCLLVTTSEAQPLQKNGQPAEKGDNMKKNAQADGKDAQAAPM
jgi:hypothetical protein